MRTRQKVEQVNAYLIALQNPKNPLNDATEDKKGCRQTSGKSRVGQAEQSIWHVRGLTELKQVRYWENVCYEALLPENPGTHCLRLPVAKTDVEI